VQADHVSGLPAIVEATGATPYLPEEATVEFPHDELGDGERVELGNTVVTAIATPGHAPAHNAYLVADRRRGSKFGSPTRRKRLKNWQAQRTAKGGPRSSRPGRAW